MVLTMSQEKLLKELSGFTLFKNKQERKARCENALSSKLISLDTKEEWNYSNQLQKQHIR